MFDNKNHYKLRTEENDGAIYYYVLFVDGQGVRRKIEVSEDIYQALESSHREEESLARKQRKYIERSELMDETLYNRAMVRPLPLDEHVWHNILLERVQHALGSLSAKQKKRFMLYQQGFTYQEIAEVEGCTLQAIEKSVKAAKHTLNFCMESG